jgi:hypothetical protein
MLNRIPGLGLPKVAGGAGNDLPSTESRPEDKQASIPCYSRFSELYCFLLLFHHRPVFSSIMSSAAFRIRTLARVAGPLRRGFATSLARGKDTKSLKKLYSSADEAVADIPSGSTILSGGASKSMLSSAGLRPISLLAPLHTDLYVLWMLLKQDSDCAVQLIHSFELFQDDQKLGT